MKCVRIKVGFALSAWSLAAWLAPPHLHAESFDSDIKAALAVIDGGAGGGATPIPVTVTVSGDVSSDIKDAS